MWKDPTDVSAENCMDKKVETLWWESRTNLYDFAPTMQLVSNEWRNVQLQGR